MGGKTGIEWTEATWNPIVGCSVVSPGCKNCYAMKMADRLASMAPRADGTGNPHLIHYEATVTRDPTGRGYDWSKPVWTGEVRLAPESTLLTPLRRKKPTTYFVNSMGDLFHESVPDEWIDRVFAVMALAPQHTFQVLTKRAARMRAYLTRQAGNGKQDVRNHIAWVETATVLHRAGISWKHLPPDKGWRARAIAAGASWPLPNVWLGVSAEDQTRADERIPDLLATPAAVRFVSAEPLLGPIELTGFVAPPDLPFFQSGTPLCSDSRCKRTGPHYPREFGCRWHEGSHTGGARPGLDWVIVGGESGPGARPMHPDWARALRDQCEAAGVPFFFKQWGEWAPRSHLSAAASYGKKAHRMDGESPNDSWVYFAGKKAAGRVLDGRIWDGMPEARR